MAGELLQTSLLEGTTGVYRFQIVDEEGAGLPVASLTTLTLTYYDVITGGIVNSRSAQNALNANGVTVTSTAAPVVTTVTWTLTADDTIILTTTNMREYRTILFQWTWASGTKSAAHEAQFAVENLIWAS